MNRYKYTSGNVMPKILYPSYKVYKMHQGEVVLDMNGQYIKTKNYNIPWTRFWQDRRNDFKDAKKELLQQALDAQTRFDNTLVIKTDITIEGPNNGLPGVAWWNVGWAHMNWAEYEIEQI